MIIVVIHFLTKRIRSRRSTQDNLSPSHVNLPSAASSRHKTRQTQEDRDRRGPFTTWGFGFPAPTDYPPIAPSPSTGITTLVTPNSDRSKLKKGFFGGIKNGSNGSKSSIRPSPVVETRSPIVLRPQSEEMVMVTYEEGLAKLGLAQPHHILYMDPNPDPPAFDEARQAYPVAPAPVAQVANSPRGIPGRSGRRSHAQRQSATHPSPRRGDVERDGSITPGLEERNERIRDWVNSPREEHQHRQPSSATTTESGRTRPGLAGLGAAGGMGVRRVPVPREYARRSLQQEMVEQGRRAQSGWLPSYYHTPERFPRDLEEASELDYRLDGDLDVSPRGGGRWGGNRI